MNKKKKKGRKEKIRDCQIIFIAPRDYKKLFQLDEFLGEKKYTLTIELFYWGSNEITIFEIREMN